jgi:DNA-binding CsgD family transcriptional regulator
VALEITGAAVVALGPEAEVVFATRAADGLLAWTPHASLRAGTLWLHDPEARAELDRLLPLPDDGSVERDVYIMLPAPEPSLMLRVVRCGLRPEGGHLVFLSSNRPDVQPSLERLRARFGLTPTEARIAAGLAQGRDLGAITEALGVRRSTVRTHLKNIRGKTKTQRQAELVRLILSVEPWFL